MNSSVIVIILGLPGALAASLFGFMIAEFSGDASVTITSFACWHVWGVFGGACLGAIPGILVGLFRRIRWVIPFFGGAIGALPGLVEAMGIHLTANVWSMFGEPVLGRQTHLGGYTSAAFVLLGFFVGLWWWLALTKWDRQGKETGAVRPSEPTH